MNHTAIILAGGKSSRFGTDKSLLLWNNRLLLERTVDNCRAIFEEILIISNQKDKFGIEGTTELSDIYRNVGPLGGIHAGLKAAKHETCFVVACDMPYVDSRLIQLLLEHEGEADVIVPEQRGRLEPLCAVYHRKLTAEIEALMKEDRRAVRALFDRVKVLRLPQKEWEVLRQNDLFYNINYPEDYERIQEENH